MDHAEIVIDKHYDGFNPVQFGYAQCTPGWGFGPAVRPYWLLHYVVSGQGRFERGGKTFHLNEGDIFVIPPFVETYYEADRQKPWYYIWVGFTADAVPPELTEHEVIHCPAAGKIFQDMRRCRDMENGKSAFLSSRIWELTALLMEDGTAAPDHIDKALSFMQSDYAAGISVATAAKQLNLDRTYFSALFKRATGVSPIDYLTALRLDKAAELIGTYGQSPSTAAVSVGYPDYCHFARMSKKRFGCAPREYRPRS